ncbi:unnamed protein product [Rotaria sordida]|uniref:Protein kinase domain-containing protein n=1 Tax=Rotaria sordida TaxID=392033 RepID=A0A814KT14_9BILA|nr:unnamed protein product [Rotaria sordida]
MATNTTSSNYRSPFHEEYKDHTLLGKGGYGVVFGAIEKDSDCPVAIKRVKLKEGTNQDKVLRELRVLSQLNHPHVLRYHNRWKEPLEYHKNWDEILAKNGNSTSSLFTKDKKQSTTNSHSNHTNYSTQFSSSLNDSAYDIISSLSIQEQNESAQSTPSSSSFSIYTPSTNDCSDNEHVACKNEDKSIASSSQNSSVYLFIATSRCKPESLRHRLLPKNCSIKKINRIDALHIFYQIIEGVKYLHDEKHLH